MIRREIDVDGEPAQWLLMSQVEHARLSGVLAEHCLHTFGQSLTDDFSKQDLEAIRRELMAAIIHHDDGWTGWESEPQLDSKHGRPPSFLELPLHELLVIWTESIRVAESIGKLAAWAVAGHFKILLEASEDNRNSVEAKAWLRGIDGRRKVWLTEWQAERLKLHTVELAEEALLWLRLCDILSLWTCLACPGGGERVAKWPENYTCVEGLPLETVIGPAGSEGDRDYPANAERCRVIVDPWRFDVAELALDAEGEVVPVRKYQSGAEVAAALTPRRMQWLLVPPII